MPAFSPDAFASALNAALPPAFSGLCVALSGGVDSVVLLQALSALRAAQPTWRLRAVHVDHQLQTASGHWAEHCLRIAAGLNVPIDIERVTVDRNHAQGLEAAAREVRYDAFRRQLGSGEVLLTAHHADDQLETMLLALMRGSGVQGLAAMPVRAPFAGGWHLRPLLGYTRAQLVEWAVGGGIAAIEDPSNQNLRHDRNYLRHSVLPALRERWPSVAANAVRSAGHLGDALELLDEQAKRDLEVCAANGCLAVESLHALSPVRRANVLRYWLRSSGLPAPSTRQLHGLERDVFAAADDRNPVTRWPGAEVHRYRGRLYAFAPLDAVIDEPRSWLWREPLPLVDGALRIAELNAASGDREPRLSLARLPDLLTVRYRAGGEQLHVAGRAHRKLLKKLLQESGVLPWWRDRLPLIFAGKRLVAVADLFLATEFAAAPGEPSARVVWDGRPEIFSAD